MPHFYERSATYRRNKKELFLPALLTWDEFVKEKTLPVSLGYKNIAVADTRAQ